MPLTYLLDDETWLLLFGKRPNHAGFWGFRGFHGLFYSPDHDCHLERLAQDGERSERERFVQDLSIGVGCDHDARQLCSALTRNLQRLYTRHDWHVNVEKQAVDHVGIENLKRMAAVFR